MQHRRIIDDITELNRAYLYFLREASSALLERLSPNSGINRAMADDVKRLSDDQVEQLSQSGRTLFTFMSMSPRRMVAMIRDNPLDRARSNAANNPLYSLMGYERLVNFNFMYLGVIRKAEALSVGDAVVRLRMKRLLLAAIGGMNLTDMNTLVHQPELLARMDRRDFYKMLDVANRPIDDSARCIHASIVIASPNSDPASSAQGERDTAPWRHNAAGSGGGP